jgi:transposase
MDPWPLRLWKSEEYRRHVLRTSRSAVGQLLTGGLSRPHTDGRIKFLPPYSPGLNPIELAFAKLKALLCSAGERDVEGLRQFLGRTLDAFVPQECRNYLRHAGYGATANCKPL